MAINKKKLRRRHPQRSAVSVSSSNCDNADVPLNEPSKPASSPSSVSPSLEVPLVPLVCSSTLVFFVSLFVYMKTLRSSIAGGDAAEMARCACNSAIAHPPGYPLWTLILGIISVISSPNDHSDSTIFHFHLVSAICSAVSIALLNAAILILVSGFNSNTDTDKDNPYHSVICSSIVSSLLFAFSSSVWRYSLESEVFALHNAIMASLVLLTILICVCEYRPMIVWASLAFTAGLALSNQHISLFFLVPLAMYLLYEHGRLLLTSEEILTAIVVGLLAGLSPYSAMMIASTKHAKHSWGGSLDSPMDFLRHFLRREYGTFQLSGSTSTVDPTFDRIWAYVDGFVSETFGVALALSIAGFMYIVNKHTQLKRPLKRTLGFFGFSYLLYIGLFHYLANISVSRNRFGLAVLARFWMQPNMLMMLLVAIGWWFLLRSIDNQAMGTGLSVAVIALVLAANWHSQDHSNNHVIRDYAKQVLESIPPNSLVLAGDDLHFNTLSYLQTCEGERPDLIVLSSAMMTWSWFKPSQKHHYPEIEFPGAVLNPLKRDGYLISDFLDANIHSFPVFVCGNLPQWKGLDPVSDARYQRWPFGVCDRLLPESEPPEDIVDSLEVAWNNVPVLPSYDPLMHAEDTWEFYVYNATWAHRKHLFDKIGPNLASPGTSALRLAKLMADVILFQDEANLGKVTPANKKAMVSMFGASTDQVWHAAIVYGVYSAKIDRTAELTMYQTLQRLLAMDPTHEIADHVVNSLVNPYTHEPIDFMKSKPPGPGLVKQEIGDDEQL